MSAERFWRRRVRTDQRWDEGIGAGGGQLGSSACRARRSLAFDSHVSFMSSLGERIEATEDGGGSQPEERHGLAAEVLRIIRRRKNPVRGVFRKYSRTQHLLWRGDSILVFDLLLPLSVPGYRQAASGSVPRGIVRAHCSYRRPPNNVNHRGRVRPATTRSDRCWKHTDQG
jgi:hypothetical protein